MSEPETLPVGIHPESALLPWYANGTLGDRERQQVAQHLESCSDCRRELEELMLMKRQLTALYAGQEELSPHVASSVMDTVAREIRGRQAGVVVCGNWLDDADQWFRSLFLPRWVPTLAAALLVIQFGLLFWITIPPTPSDQITTRSLGSPTAKFKILFQDGATMDQVRTLLNDIHGRIIDGPDAEHRYVIEVISDNSAAGARALEVLRDRKDSVQTAEAIAP